MQIFDTAAVARYNDVGVYHARGLISNEWVARLRAVIDSELSIKKSKHFAFQEGETGRFLGSQDLWRTDETCREFCTNSTLPRAAAEMLGSDEVNLFFDHLFVKEPGASFDTSWHNDVPYWPIKGSQILSIWIALDRVTRENGALSFINGSHRWNAKVQPATFGEKADQRRSMMELSGQIPAELGDYSSLDIDTFEMEAGDALIFDGKTIHQAGGNHSTNMRRRGYVVRYTGDDVLYDPRPGVHKMMLERSLAPNDRITCERFPLVWS
ncbi:phytanoyl-CoA dioxygenase family protein [Mesorhizobium montanum]|nr:phytanoyl-CoA dioxygenase family protein [Mesorhizobium sp. MSK_1335]